LFSENILVAWDAKIDFVRPTINATINIENLLKTTGNKKLCSFHAPDAPMAHQQQSAIRIPLVQNFFGKLVI
jgi:hypothetical protein